MALAPDIVTTAAAAAAAAIEPGDLMLAMDPLDSYSPPSSAFDIGAFLALGGSPPYHPLLPALMIPSGGMLLSVQAGSHLDSPILDQLGRPASPLGSFALDGGVNDLFPHSTVAAETDPEFPPGLFRH